MASVTILTEDLPKTSYDVLHPNMSNVGFRNFFKTFTRVREDALSAKYEDPFIPELISETIDMLQREDVLRLAPERDKNGKIIPNTFRTLEQFLDAFYIVNNSDVRTFGNIEKPLLQTYFNSLGNPIEHTQPAKYIQLTGVDEADNLKAFIVLYVKYIFPKMTFDGGKRRKSISRTRGPSKPKRRRLSTKRTTRRTRRTRTRRRR